MHLALSQQLSKQRTVSQSEAVISKKRSISIHTNSRPYTSKSGTNKYVNQLAILGRRGLETITSFFRKYIPGFRTEKIWKRVIAIVCYTVLFIGIVGNVFGQPTGSLKVREFIDYLFIFLIPILLFTNFLNYQRKLPLISSDNKIYRYIGYGLLFLFWIVITKGGLELNSFIYKRIN